MSEKPKSALSAMLSRVIVHADALHDELHEFEDELSHHVAHVLKKIAKLTTYVEIEIHDRRAPDVVSLITRNMGEIQEDLTDLIDDAAADPAIRAIGEAIYALIIIMRVEWNSAPVMEKPDDPIESFLTFVKLLNKMVPMARADIAVRHAYLGLREFSKFWRADDDRLATLGLGHEHEHDHGHHPEEI